MRANSAARHPGMGHGMTGVQAGAGLIIAFGDALHPGAHFTQEVGGIADALAKAGHDRVD